MNTPDDLFARLKALNIASSTVEHPPVFTVEQAREHRGDLDGVHIKNLFLRDRKKRMWLLVVLEDQVVDMKTLPAILGSARLSFGSGDRLMEFLGVIPGAVTPFAAMNDAAGAVEVAIEAKVLAGPPVHCHPLTNAKTTAIDPKDLVRFLEDCGHPPRMVRL